MKAENRHHTVKWKKRRKHREGDRCNNAQCTICHSNKVIGIPSRQELRLQTNREIIDELSYHGEGGEWDIAQEIARQAMFED